MLIGWPDDVYVDYDPTTWGAKFFAFVALPPHCFL